MKDLLEQCNNVLEGKEENIEEAFMRLPSTVIGSDLYSLQKDLSDFMYSQDMTPGEKLIQYIVDGGFS